jgi:hypothetical protein
MASVADSLMLDGRAAESSDGLPQDSVRGAPGPYALATGEAADYRLRLEAGLRRAGRAAGRPRCNCSWSGRGWR